MSCNSYFSVHCCKHCHWSFNHFSELSIQVFLFDAIYLFLTPANERPAEIRNVDKTRTECLFKPQETKGAFRIGSSSIGVGR